MARVRGRVRALLLVVLVLASGCAAPGHAPAQAGDPPAKRLDFDGVALPGARPPAGDAVGRQAYPFEADATHGFIEVNLTYADPVGGDVGLDATLVDPWGRIQCAAIQAAPPKTCTAPIPRNASRPATWRVEVGGGWAADAPATSYHLAVVLHPRGEMTTGDPANGTDASISFRVADTGVRGFEPTVGALRDGTILVQESLRTMRSRDEGRTWQDVSPPTPQPLSADAMMRVDPWSGRAYAAQLLVACSALSWTPDAGASWTTNPCTSTPPPEDHEKLAVGPPLLPTGAPVVYYSWYSFEKAVWVARSLDGGLVFTTAPVPLPADAQPLNTGPVEADRAGDVYLPLYFCDHGGWLGMGVSHDAGATFRLVRVADGPRSCDDLELDPGVGVDGAGTAYVAFDSPAGVQLAFSRDHGETWSAPLRVQPPGLKSWRNVDVVAGDAGRVAIAYRGNADSAKPHEESEGWSAWRMYVTFVENATGPAPRVATALVGGPEHVTQRGAICQHFEPVCPNGRNLGDFLDVQALPDGRVVVAYDSGCPDAGCETPGDSQLSRGLVSVETSGPRLFAGRAPWAT